MSVLHADKLKNGETVMRVSIPGFDHSWAELRRTREDEGRIVMDAWAEGPAVLSSDGTFTNGGVEPRPLSGYTAPAPKNRLRADPLLQSEVMAAYVARSLGESAAAAVRDAPRIVQLHGMSCSEPHPN